MSKIKYASFSKYGIRTINENCSRCRSWYHQQGYLSRTLRETDS